MQILKLFKAFSTRSKFNRWFLVNKNANFITKLTKPFMSSQFWASTSEENENEMSEAKMLPKRPLGGTPKV